MTESNKTVRDADLHTPEVDFSAWDPGISIIMSGIREQVENGIVRFVQECGVKVDKAKLIEALEHSQDQFRRGFEAGIKSVEKQIVRCGQCARGTKETEGAVAGYINCPYQGYGELHPAWWFCADGVTELDDE